MAEDFEFMDNIEDMLSVEGIDTINFGPADYALSKNIHIFYDMNQPDVQSAMAEISKKFRVKGVGLMAPAVPPTKENIETLISRGVNMVICGSGMYDY